MPTYEIYYGIPSKRGIPVSQFRFFEKQGLKVVKLRLDSKYFENCLDLDLCPEFLKFKAPNLRAYQTGRKEIHGIVVEKKLGEVVRECKLAERKFEKLKTDIWAKLSFFGKELLNFVISG